MPALHRRAEHLDVRNDEKAGSACKPRLLASCRSTAKSRHMSDEDDPIDVEQAPPAAAATAERTRWSKEHVDKETCAERSKKISPALDTVMRPFYRELVEGTSTLLNCPAAFITHQLSAAFASAAPYTRASRWHAVNGGHVEALNFQKLLGAESGAGKSQAMREVINHVTSYEKTTGRDLIARNITIESLEARMHHNAHRDPCLVKSVARQGGALVMMDEAAKLVSLGQYKSGGKGDHRERWMEASNGELVKTDRKGSATKMAMGKADSPEGAGLVATPSSGGRSADDDDEGEEEFSTQLKTEQYWAHMNSILFTHPFRCASWTWDEQAADGTDGWTVRLKTVLVESERKCSLPRDELIELAESAALATPLYHLLVAGHILCELLPIVEGVPFKLLEFDNDCEDEYLKWDEWVTENINALKGVPSSGLQIAVYSKSIGDLIKETAIAGLQRISELAVVAAAPKLSGYTGFDMAYFRDALSTPLQAHIDGSSVLKAKDGSPQLLIQEDIDYAMNRVKWEMDTAFSLMQKAVLESAPAALPSVDALAARGAASGAADDAPVDPNFGRHDLQFRLKKSDFKKPKGQGPGQEYDKITHLLHIVLTAPRVAPNMISLSWISSASHTPRIYATRPEKPNESESGFGLVSELAERGLASLQTEIVPNEKDLTTALGLKANAKRYFVRVVDLTDKSPQLLQAYETELSRVNLTVAKLNRMNAEIMPLDVAGIKAYGIMRQLTRLYRRSYLRARDGLASEEPAAEQAAEVAPVRPGSAKPAAEQPAESAHPQPNDPSEMEMVRVSGLVTAADEAALQGLGMMAPPAAAAGVGLVGMGSPPRQAKRTKDQRSPGDPAAPKGKAPIARALPLAPDALANDEFMGAGEEDVDDDFLNALGD